MITESPTMFSGTQTSNLELTSGISFMIEEKMKKFRKFNLTLAVVCVGVTIFPFLLASAYDIMVYIEEETFCNLVNAICLTLISTCCVLHTVNHLGILPLLKLDSYSRVERNLRIMWTVNSIMLLANLVGYTNSFFSCKESLEQFLAYFAAPAIHITIITISFKRFLADVDNKMALIRQIP